MYINESIKIDKNNLPLDLKKEIDLMDSICINNNAGLYVFKLNEIYAIAKTYMLSNLIDAKTCEMIWKRYGVE